MSTSSTPTDNVLQKNFEVPVHMTDLSTFDENFSTMKERFAEEMRRVDEEMNRFSVNLNQFYVSTGIALSQSRPTSPAGSATNWEALANSPLLVGDGKEKTLKLQFDVSQFSPDEITVKIHDNVLIVSAVHDERSDRNTVYQEYNREFLLPIGMDVKAIVSSLSRDGVLTIQAPFPLLPFTEELRKLGPVIAGRA